MNSFHKIFLVAIIFLSAAAGNRLSGVSSIPGNKFTSIIVSTSVEKTMAENSAPAGKIEPETPNNSTAKNEIQTSGKSNILFPTKDNSKSALDNDTILKSNLTAGTDAFRHTGSETTPDIQAQSAIVADLKTGQVYFEFNSNLRWPMVSLVELMTAAAAMKNMDLNKQIKIEDISSGEEATTSTLFFKSNEIYSANDTLSLMLMTSSGEALRLRSGQAAESLAGAHGRDNLIHGMNVLAGEYGMGSTNFSDPTGFSVSDQSTASDLKKLALNIYQNYPKIFDITRKKSAAIVELNSKKKKIISNGNKFIGMSGFAGGVSGYSDDAGGNALSVFSYGGRQVLVIILGANDSFGETGKLFEWFKNNFKKS